MPETYFRHGQWWAQQSVRRFFVTGLGPTKEAALADLERELKRLPR